MRNLKRVLSLALAAIMLIGMMAIGTSAASVSDFTDAEKITNLEAASVTTAIGIFDGYGDGSFGGDNYVTRAQMATIICKLLLGSNLNADIYKGIGSFQDLTGNEWAEGYINMCASRGIVNGTSATTFEPGRPVKTWEAALMLQRALGWWAVNDPLNSTINEVTVSAKSSALGLYGDLVLYANDYLTRNDVAEMVFNAITKSVPVEYNESFSLYRNAASTNIFSGVTYNYRETLGYQTFGLVYAAGETDAYGRPATTWGYGRLDAADIDTDGDIKDDYTVTGNAKFRTPLVTVADAPVLEYTTTVRNNTLYTALNLSGSTTKFDLYVDGKDETSTAAIPKNSSVLKSVADTEITGNGILTQVFKNADGATNPYTVVVINTYIMNIGTVTEATRNAAAKVTVAAREYSPLNYPYASASFDSSYETEAFAKDDVVLITVAYRDSADGGDNKYHIETMQLADSLQGEMTRYTETANTMVVGGVTYSFDKNSSQNANEYKGNGGAVGDNVIVYLDNYGYAIDVQNAGNELVTNYALVLAVDTDSASVFNNTNAWAKLLMMDGTVVEAKFSWSAGQVTAGNQWSYDTLKVKGTMQTKTTLYTGVQTLVTYSVSSSGTYTLYQLGTSNANCTTWQGVKTDSNRSVASNVGGAAASKFMNNGTVLILPVDKSKDRYEIYTGVRNIPNINETGATQLAINPTNSSLVDVIYSETTIASTSNDLIYIASKGEYVNDKNLGPYVNYTAVINGAITELKVQGELKAQGVVDTAASTNIVENALYNSITTNSDGIVTSAVFAVEDTAKDGHGDYYAGTGIVRANKDIIGVGATDAGATYYTWSDDVLVARIEKDGDHIIVSNPNITSLPTIRDAIVYYGVASGNAGQINWIYVVDSAIGGATTAGETKTYTLGASEGDVIKINDQYAVVGSAGVAAAIATISIDHYSLSINSSGKLEITAESSNYDFSEITSVSVGTITTVSATTDSTTTAEVAAKQATITTGDIDGTAKSIKIGDGNPITITDISQDITDAEVLNGTWKYSYEKSTDKFTVTAVAGKTTDGAAGNGVKVVVTSEVSATITENQDGSAKGSVSTSAISGTITGIKVGSDVANLTGKDFSQDATGTVGDWTWTWTASTKVLKVEATNAGTSAETAVVVTVEATVTTAGGANLVPATYGSATYALASATAGVIVVNGVAYEFDTNVETTLADLLTLTPPTGCVVSVSGTDLKVLKSANTSTLPANYTVGYANTLTTVSADA